jgi:hypothetical protein
VRKGQIGGLAAALDAYRSAEDDPVSGYSEAYYLGRAWHTQREARMAEFLELGVGMLRSLMKEG